MAQQQHQQAPAATYTPEQAASLLDQVLAETIDQHKLDNWFDDHEANLEELLPDAMKGQAHRLYKRAMLTFSNKPELQHCTPASFVKCVLGAAELGLAIDGRLAHAVPFRGVASLIVDYKGIIAVARRTKIIKDCYARIVYEGDEFEASDVDGQCHLAHRRLFKSKNPTLVYAIVRLHGGDWRYELMDMQDCDDIRKRSRSWQSGSGPWATDDGEMRKKTVLKRALKTYCDDPAIIRALELDDRDYEQPIQPDRQSIPMPKAIEEKGSAPATEADQQPADTTAEIDVVETWRSWLTREPDLEAFNENIAEISNLEKRTKASVWALIQAFAEKRGWAFDKKDKKFKAKE